MRRAGQLAVAVTTAASVALAVAALCPACTDHQCDGSGLLWGDIPGQGEIVQPLPEGGAIWESNPVDGNWLPFPGGGVVYVHLHDALSACYPVEEHGYISADPKPANMNDNWSEATGNLGEFVYYAPGQFAFVNGTCGNYYLRLVITCGPESAPDAGGSDSGTDVASDAGEVGADAPEAGSSD